MAPVGFRTVNGVEESGYNMRKIIKTVCFIIGLVMILTFTSGIMTRKSGGDINMIRSFYDLDRNSLDVLCLGSSHAYYGFQPNVLWNEKGLASYIMGSPSQTMVCSYYLLEEALKYQKPKVVLLEGYYFITYQPYINEHTLRSVTDEIRMGRPRISLLREAIPDLPWKEQLSYYFPFLLYHNRWNDLKDCDFKYHRYLKGSRITTTIEPYSDPGMDVKAKEIPEMAREYFEKILALCRENDIELVVFEAPFTDTDGEKIDWYKHTMGIAISMEDYLAERNVPYLFFQKSGIAKIDFNTDLFNAQHLNSYGAEKLTKCIGDFLVNQYGLKSHKGEASYSQWDKDYEEYQKALDQLLDTGEEETEINDV